MSYREEGDLVILSMSREDYDLLMGELDGINVLFPDRDREHLVNRLNSGNPNYTPYQVEVGGSTPRSAGSVDQSPAEATRKAVKPL